MDVVYNQGNSTVIIVDNSTTGMTGHQENPTTGKNLRGDPRGRSTWRPLPGHGHPPGAGGGPLRLKATEQVVTEELAAEERR